MKFAPGLLCIAALAMSASVSAEVMDNKTVLELAKAGLSDGLIIEKIESEPCGYDVSTSSIIALNRAGLSEDVISAMVRRCATLSAVRGTAGDDSSPDPTVRHSPGIYVMEDWRTPNAMQKIRPSKSSGVRTSGNGSILFPLKAKLVLQSSDSKVTVLSASPDFYFYFNPSDPNVSDFGLENSLAAQSPNEFTLVRFKLKDGARELEVGKASAYGGAVVSFRQGINPKLAIPLHTEDMGNGIFKVTPSKPLVDGEYAFVLSGADGSARIYDFSVEDAEIAKTAAK